MTPMNLAGFHGVAALFVATGGVYFNRADVDPWDVTRDARTYAGPWPVVAHPPCERWGRYWFGGPTAHKQGRRRTLGDDGGCFAAALGALRMFGGVLEHPEGSHAWRAFGLATPLKTGGWIPADFGGTWTCCVEQGHYGHRARKATWLLYVGDGPPPTLVWGRSAATAKIDLGYHSSEERRAAIAAGKHEGILRMTKTERTATPILFAELLINIAKSARRDVGAEVAAW